MSNSVDVEVRNTEVYFRTPRALRPKGEGMH
jgi:hypothetical protein